MNFFSDTRVDYTTPGFVNPSIERCTEEFGPHEDHSECERIMDGMNGYSDYDDGYAYSYNRELEEDMLGRPLFPNEY